MRKSLGAIVKEQKKKIQQLRKDKKALLNKLFNIEAEQIEKDKHSELQLEEARRHTIPLMQGNAIVNFRPLYVRSYRIESDIKHASSWSGHSISYVGSRIALIECTGDILVFPVDGIG